MIPVRTAGQLEAVCGLSAEIDNSAVGIAVLAVVEEILKFRIGVTPAAVVTDDIDITIGVLVADEHAVRDEDTLCDI